jgi:hypothetical protein
MVPLVDEAMTLLKDIYYKTSNHPVAATGGA